MPWFNRTNHQEQIGGLQKILQDENDVFHMAIIALERLEERLCVDEQKEVHLLKRTAIGTKGDHHTAETNKRDKKGWLYEILLHTKSIYLCSDYDDKETFDTAVKLFLENILEWYAGRQLLSYYDAVDACVIPLMLAISHQKVDFDDIFKKYVADIFTDTVELSLEQRFERTQKGFDAFIKGQYLVGKEQQNQGNQSNEDVITNHKRGNMEDGYRRIMNALTSDLCKTSAPAKLFYKAIAEHLPIVASSIAEINEDSIEQLYASKETAKAEVPFIPIEDGKSDDKHTFEDVYPILQDAVKAILDKEGISYNKIIINIQ